MATDPITDIAERWQRITAAAAELHARVESDRNAASEGEKREQDRHAKAVAAIAERAA